MESAEDWQPLTVNEVKSALLHFNGEWAIGGGWAIDLFVGAQTRQHGDIDILIARRDQARLHDALSGWELWASDPPGNLRPWAKAEELSGVVQDIWCREIGSKAWRFQIILFDVENGEWVFKRDRSIRRALSEVISSDASGVRFLAPEVQLLYKARDLRAKDQHDFDCALPKMSSSARRWLSEQLAKLDPRHAWLTRLRE